MPDEASLNALRAAILRVFPGHASSRFTLLTHGWDCLAVDVDGRLIFKFPRHARAGRALRTEARVLALVRPQLAMVVPDVTLHEGPPLFFVHPRIPGEHLETPGYLALAAADRARLAAAIAHFFAQLHAMPADAMAASGAVPIAPWPAPEVIRAGIAPLLPDGLRGYAQQTLEAWQRLPPDPHGSTWGFFDGHGWNMAFDHARGRLNGFYDFGDSGFGPLHREFVYPGWIARDLALRIVAEYETLTGRFLDRERIDLLGGVLRLSELAAFADDAGLACSMVRSIGHWASACRDAGT